jgi:hypothetical protein
LLEFMFDGATTLTVAANVPAAPPRGLFRLFGIGSGSRSLRRTLALASLFCLLACLVVAAEFGWKTNTTTTAPNSQVLAQQSVRTIVEDLGNVAPESLTPRSVSIHNDSSFPWTVARIHADCGCLLPRIDPPVIAAGGDASLSLVYRAPSGVNAIHRHVSILFREPKAPTFAVDITGFVQPWCYTDPPSVNFGPIAIGSKDKPPSRNVVLRLKPGATLNSQRPANAPDWLTFSWLSKVRTEDRYGNYGEAITVQLTPLGGQTSPGPIAGEVTFESTGVPPERLVLPVSATVVPSISAAPNRLFCGVHQVGDRFVETIAIRDQSPSRNAVSSDLHDRIDVTHNLGSHLVTQLRSGDHPGYIDLECRFTMPSSECFIAGTIALSYEGRKALVVPVSVKVVPRK